MFAASLLPIGHATSHDSVAVSVTCSPSPIQYGATSQCTATLTDTTPTPNNGAPQGTVDFAVTPTGGTITPSSTCTLGTTGSETSACSMYYSSTLYGTKTVNATYTHSTQAWVTSATGVTTLTVTQRATSASVSCSPTTLLVGTITACTVTVTDTSAGSPITPTGTVTMSSTRSGSFTACTLTGSNGVSTCSSNYTPGSGSEGAITITATYPGDPIHSSSSNTASVTSTIRSSSTSLSCAPFPDSVGVPTTCIVTIVDTSAGTPITPSGTVTFSDSPASSGTFSSSTCTLSTGTCSVTYTPSRGNEGHIGITASFAGDTDHTASSSTFSLTAVQRTSSTTIACTSTEVLVNAVTTCTATVSDTSSGPKITPSAPITFNDNPLSSGSFSASTCNPAGSGGTASCSITYSPSSVGLHTLFANYTGEVDLSKSVGSVGANSYDFGINVTASQTLLRSNNTTYTVTLTLVAGSTGTIPAETLSVTGLPSDSTSSLSQTFKVPTLAGATVTLTVTTLAGSSGSLGDFLFAVSGIDPSASGGSRSGNSVLRIYDYSITIVPNSETIIKGDQASYSVSVSLLPGSTTTGLPATILLSLTGAPASSTANLASPIQFPTSTGSPTGTTLTVLTSSSTPGGTYVLTVTGSVATGTHSGSSSLTIHVPSITLNPNSGVVGLSVTVTGTNFASSTTITITFDNSTVTTASSGPSGLFSATFTVPSSITGSHSVTATDGLHTAQTGFTTLPSISLTPSSGIVGTTITVSGNGFAALTTITIKFDGTTQSTTPSTVTSTNIGSFSATLAAPISIHGTYTVLAIDSSSNSASASFNIISAITLGASSGTVSSTVTISGTGFAGSSAITVKYDGTTMITTPASITSSTSGIFTATFSVPASTNGAHLVRADDGSSNSASTSYSVAASESLSPNTGTSGSTLTITGFGFSSSSPITIIFDSSIIGTSSTDAAGSFIAALTAPVSTEGTHNITSTDGASHSAFSTYQLIPGISLSPGSGPVATSVTVSGTSFTTTSTVTITFGSSTVGTATTNAIGSFTATFTVPVSTFGAHSVTATDSLSQSASTAFSVSASITLNPSSGAVGTIITVTGAGFDGSSTVSITYDGTTLATSPTTVATSTTGSFSATFVAVESINGVHIIMATDVASQTASTPFTITSSIHLDPTSNIVGSNVTVTGTGFAGSSTITIQFDGTTISTYPNSVVSSSLGSLTAIFAVPSSTIGVHTVTAFDALGNSASAPLTVLVSITIQVSITVPNGGPTGTATLAGCLVNPSKIALDGVGHSISATPSCTVSVTVPGDGPTTRFRFSGSSSTMTFNTCASGTCPALSSTVFYQLINTYAAAPSTPTTWDAPMSIAVTGTISGSLSSTGCTINTVSGGSSVSCQGWFDYNTLVTVTAPIPVASGEQWAASANTFTDVNSGLIHVVPYTNQFQVSFATSPIRAGTTNPSGTTGWLDYGTTISITETANSTYSFVTWTTNSAGITFSPSATANPVTATIQGPGTITANFVTGLDCLATASGTTPLITATLTNCKANDLIIVFVTQDSDNTVANITDTSGLTYTLRLSGTETNNQEIEEWWARVGSSAISTDSIIVAINGLSSHHTNVIVVGFSGLAVAPFDSNVGLPYRFSSATGRPSVSGVATSNANDLVFALVGSTGPDSDSAAGAFSLVTTQNQNGEVASVEYETISATLQGTTIFFDNASSSQGHWVMIVDALVRVTSQIAQPVTISTIGTNLAAIVTVSGCDVFPGSITADGTQVTLAADPSCTLVFTVPVDAASARYRFSSAGIPSLNWTITGCLTGTCSRQSNVVYYQLLETLSYTIVDGGSPTAPTLTAVVLGSSSAQSLTTTPIGYWFDSGASWTVTDPISGGTGERWQIDIASQVDSGTFSFPQTVAFSYTHQYFLTISSAHDTPTPSSGWVTSGSSVTAKITSPVGAGTGVRYITTGWTGSGSVPSTGSASSLTFSMNSTSSVTWNWQLQYLLTIQTSGLPSSHPTAVYLDGVSSGIASDSTPFTLWINDGASSGTIGIDITISGGSNIGYFFTNWDDSSTNNPRSSDTMSGPVIHIAAYGTDTTAPVIVLTETPNPNSNGWNSITVSVSWSVSDGESGIASSSGCGPVTLSSETAGTTVTCSAIDGAGLISSSSTIVKIDETNPVLSGTASPSPNSNGWNNANVTVTFTCGDSLSGVAAGPLSPQTISTEGAGQSRSATCVDKAGNSVSVIVGGIDIDKTSPTITGSRSSPPNLNGWNNAAVTVSFVCSDGLSGVSSFSSPSTLGEGAGQSVTGTCLDAAGNSASTTVSNVNIDITPPSISGTASPSPNSNGWYNANVAVSFTCNDALSGVDSSSSPVTLSVEGQAESASGTCLDKAGNSASVTVGGINIDKTSPTITGSRSSPPNLNGWNNITVTVSFACSDGLSGVSTSSSPTTLGEGAGQSVMGTCLDRAGNAASATVSNVNIDLTLPSITSARSVAPNSHGWNNSPVTVSFACTDSLSGVSNLSSPRTLGQGFNQTVLGLCVDLAGNPTTTLESAIDIDLTQPLIAGSRSPGPNTFGWNNSTVIASFTCTDALSGVDTLSTPTTLNLEGPQSVTGTCTDLAGNSASATIGNINIDLTPPSITSSRSVPPNTQGWNNNPVTISFACDDSLSGVSSVSGPTTLGEGGGQSVRGSCTDRAGNSATTSQTNVNIDLTAPIITGLLTPSPNSNGWVNTTATVNFTCSDSLSGVSFCSSPAVPPGEGFGISVTGLVTDLAGNNATITVSNINIDKTAPVLSFARSPQPNQNGWNDVAVTVTFACADPLSGVDSYSGQSTTATEGKDQSVTGFCIDRAGNRVSLTAGNINVDLTPPTITGSRNPGPDIFGGTIGSVTVTFICTDPLSGVANVTEPVTLGNGDGQSVTGTCTDGAGNQSFTVLSGINVGINTSLVLLVVLIVASALSTVFLIMFRRKRRSQFIWDLPPNQGSEDAMPKPVEFTGEDAGTG